MFSNTSLESLSIFLNISVLISSIYLYQGLSFNRPKVSRRRAICDEEAKKAYLENARQFAASLAEGLDEDGMHFEFLLNVQRLGFTAHIFVFVLYLLLNYQYFLL